MNNDIEKALDGLYKDDYQDVVNYIEFLKSKRVVRDGILYEKVPGPGDCWTMADKEEGFRQFYKTLEEMRKAPRTGPVEHSWTREELYERH